MNKRRTAGLAALAMLVAACTAPGGSTPGSTGSDGEGIPHPEGDALVLSIADEGGFVMIDWLARRTPGFVLLGDGRVVVPGAVPMIFPGPALPALQVRTLTEDGIQAVLAAAAGSGLFGADLDLRGAQNFVADATDTVFALHADGREVMVRVYALGLLEPGAPPPQGISADELAAHRTLARLRDDLLALDMVLPDSAWLDDWHPFAPEAFRLYVRDASGEQPNPDVGPQPVRDWPLDVSPAAFGAEDPIFGDGTRCGIVSGDQAAVWLEELSRANELTRWADGDGRAWSVIARPLLPYEEQVCPPLVGGG